MPDGNAPKLSKEDTEAQQIQQELIAAETLYKAVLKRAGNFAEGHKKVGKGRVGKIKRAVEAASCALDCCHDALEDAANEGGITLLSGGTGKG